MCKSGSDVRLLMNDNFLVVFVEGGSTSYINVYCFDETISETENGDIWRRCRPLEYEN